MEHLQRWSVKFLIAAGSYGQPVLQEAAAFFEGPLVQVGLQLRSGQQSDRQQAQRVRIRGCHEYEICPRTFGESLQPVDKARDFFASLIQVIDK